MKHTHTYIKPTYIKKYIYTDAILCSVKSMWQFEVNHKPKRMTKLLHKTKPCDRNLIVMENFSYGNCVSLEKSLGATRRHRNYRLIILSIYLHVICLKISVYD
ncbi:hypothetical protein NL108_010943 [Boleophthalmus pectinirostris]|nr:hypothetical protein NL108_010943 [Boleophthalmus pectinirostris]